MKYLNKIVILLMLAAFLLTSPVFSIGQSDEKNDKLLSVHPVDPDKAILKQRTATTHLPSGMLSGSTAYANNLWADSLYSFDIDNPAGFTNIAGTTYLAFCGDFAPGDTERMWIIDYLDDSLKVVDIATGVATFVVDLPCPMADGVWSSLSIHKSTGQFYAIATDESQSLLYTFDPADGTLQQVMDMGLTTAISSSFDASGMLYVFNIETDKIYTVDVLLATITELGSAGFDGNYAQGMGYDPVADEVYLAAYEDLVGPQLRKLDRSTGAAILIANLPGETGAFGFPVEATEVQVYAGSDVTISEETSYYLAEAIAVNYSSLQWTTTNGDGVFDDETLLNPTYTLGDLDIEIGEVELCITASSIDGSVVVSDCMLLTRCPSPSVFAGNDFTVCEVDPVVLSQATASDYGSVLWTTSGSGYFVPPNSLNPIYVPSPADYLLGCITLSVKAFPRSICPSPPAEDHVIVCFQKNPSVNAGADATICEGGSFTPSATSQNTCGLSWTTTGDGTFDATGNYTSGPGDISNGSVILCLTGAACAPCTQSVQDCMTLTIQAKPTVFAGNDITICEGDLVVLSQATAFNYGALQWFTTNGLGLFNHENILNPTYTPSPLDYMLGCIVLGLAASAINPCAVAAVDYVNVCFQMKPSVDAGADATICEGGSFTASATSQNTCGLSWTTTGTGTLGNPGSLTTTYTPSTADINSGSVTLCLTGLACAPCTQSAQDCMTLTFQALPIVNAGADATICGGGSFTPLATSQNTCGLSWTTTGTGTFGNPGSLTTTFTPSTADINSGSVTLCLTGQACAPCSQSVQDCMILTIKALPIVNAGADATICEDGSFTPLATANNTCGLSWTTTGSGTFGNPGSLITTYTPSIGDINAGSVTLCLTGLACPLCTQSAQDCMTLTIQAKPTVFAGNDFTVCEGQPVVLSQATASNYGTLQWITTNGLGYFNHEDILNPTYYPTPLDYMQGCIEIGLYAGPISPCTVGADDYVTVCFQKNPSVDAGADATICADGSHTTTATANNTCGLSWTTTGSGTFGNPGSLITTYTPSIGDINAGSVTLCLTGQACAPCTQSAQDCMTLTFQALPQVNAGFDVTLNCDAQSFTLPASAYNTCGLIWLTPDGTGSFNDAAILNTNYVFSSQDIANGEVTLCLYGAACPPCTQDAEDCMTITFKSCCPPACENFDDGTHNFVSYNIDKGNVSSPPIIVIESPGSGGYAGDLGIEVTDRPGGTWIYNTVDFGGNYLECEETCLCWDMNVMNVDTGSSVYNPAIYFFKGFDPSQPTSTTNPQFLAKFTSYSQTGYQQWVNTCAPIKPANGYNPPLSADGTWQWVHGTMNWNTFISGIQGVMFDIDITSIPTEIIMYDSICLQSCQCYDCCFAEIDPGFTHIWNDTIFYSDVVWDNKYYIDDGVMVTMDGAMFDITNVDVVFGECAGMEFINGGYLRANNSVFRPCDIDETWKGLRFETPGEFDNIVNECTFKNAEVALYFEGGSDAVVSNGLFSNCNYGIRVEGNNNFNHPISGNRFVTEDFYPDFACDSSYSFINNNVSYGIYSEYSRFVSQVSHNEFLNSKGNAFPITYGIYQVYGGGMFSENTFTDMSTAVTLLQQMYYTSIENNEIEMNLRVMNNSTSIFVLICNGPLIEVLNNEIKNNDSEWVSLSAIYAANSTNLNIVNNEIEGFNFGIINTGTTNHQISSNVITNTHSAGIYVFEQPYSSGYITCNSIKMKDYNGSFGILANNMSSMSEVSSNCITDCYTSMNFNGWGSGGNLPKLPLIRNNFLYNYSYVGINVQGHSGNIGTKTDPGLNTLWSNNNTATDINSNTSITVADNFGMFNISYPMVQITSNNPYHSTASCGHQIFNMPSQGNLNVEYDCDNSTGKSGMMTGTGGNFYLEPGYQEALKSSLTPFEDANMIMASVENPDLVLLNEVIQATDLTSNQEALLKYDFHYRNGDFQNARAAMEMFVPVTRDEQDYKTLSMYDLDAIANGWDEFSDGDVETMKMIEAEESVYANLAISLLNNVSGYRDHITEEVVLPDVMWTENIKRVETDGSYLNIYPNPVTNTAYIEFIDNTGGNSKIEVFDISGKLVTDISLNMVAGGIEMDVQQLQNGIYFVTITNPETGFIQKGKLVKIEN